MVCAPRCAARAVCSPDTAQRNPGFRKLVQAHEVQNYEIFIAESFVTFAFFVVRFSSIPKTDWMNDDGLWTAFTRIDGDR